MWDLFHASAVLRPFPEPDAVFVADQIGLARHLHPLFTIDLAAINSSWSGPIHLLSPLEPCEGYVGDHTAPFHSPLLRRNWIGFHIEGGRYRLAGDLRYFALEAPERLDADLREALEEHYRDEEASYRASRAYFRKHHQLVRLGENGEPSRSFGGEPVELVEFIGGGDGEPIVGGNWAAGQYRFPMEEDGAFNVWPLSPAGSRFQFVAAVPGWRYRNSGADSILLFYEPIDKLALLTFDWT